MVHHLSNFCEERSNSNVVYFAANYCQERMLMFLLELSKFGRHVLMISQVKHSSKLSCVRYTLLSPF